MLLQILGLSPSGTRGVLFQHDTSLVVFSYLIAVCGSYASLEMIERWQNARGAKASYWQLASAVALGGSIWSTHFVAMLAVKIELPLTYGPGLTALSLLIAIGVVGLGFLIVRPRSSWMRLCCAGLTVGFGIVAMHYVGMAAVHFPGSLAYTPGPWSLSLVVGPVAATVLLWFALHVREAWQRFVAALVMGGAICSIHYTGMASTVFQAEPLFPVVPGLAAGFLAAMVISTTLALLLFALMIVAADRRILASTMHEAETLRDANRQLAQANAELDLGRQQLGVVLDNMNQGVCFFDKTQRLRVWNHRYAEIYNLPSEALGVGSSLEEILDHRHAVGSTPEMSASDYLIWRNQIAATNKISNTTATLRNGRVISLYYQPMPDGGWVATHEDITERQEVEARIVFMARHDALTQLPNRILFHERLEQAIGLVGRGIGCAVLCLDLDHFKRVNDLLGHPAGDGLLQAAADRLRACIREVDTLARLGGDEFVMIQHAAERPDDVAPLADRIVAAFLDPFDIDGHEVVVGISIGVAVAPGDGTSPLKLLKSADIALYLAKTEGRGTVRFFEPEMDALIQLRRALELDLQSAIVRNEFEIYYQPLVNLATGRIAAFEGLLRWHHPLRGLILPAEFIPVAEEMGMIVTIGEWVLRTACFEAVGWPAEIKLAVNLSPIQFRKGDLIATVVAALEGSGLRPDRLELEITESVQLQDTPDTVRTLHRLRTMGIAIALDDFGTGYSSLSHLRSFPFDKIKIDQSFVQDLVKNDDAMAIIRAVTGLGHNLNMITTAEGVEGIEQLDKLRKEGCTEVQGSIFSPPKSASELLPLIESFNRMVGQASGREGMSGC